MDRRIGLWQMAGFLFTSVVGTLLHFLYDWSGQNPVVGLFSGVNESIWEHMKLIYFPMLVFALFQRRFWRGENFWQIKLTGMVTALILIPAVYYTYTGALGISVDWLNIGIFFLAAGVAYYREPKGFQGKADSLLSSGAALVVLLTIGILFWVFTFCLPGIPLFAAHSGE